MSSGELGLGSCTTQLLFAVGSQPAAVEMAAVLTASRVDLRECTMATTAPRVASEAREATQARWCVVNRSTLHVVKRIICTWHDTVAKTARAQQRATRRTAVGTGANYDKGKVDNIAS